MRQGQQNRRGRGRNNGHGHNQGHNQSHNQGHAHNQGRKSQNLLSKNYESSGPDIKIRGTAHHIAEKYAHLARDAAASGDFIMSENYLQHAEHYNRIIMAAQAAAPERPQAQQPNLNAAQDAPPADATIGAPPPAVYRQPRITDEQPEYAMSNGETRRLNPAVIVAEIATSGPQPVAESEPLQPGRAPRDGLNGRNRRRRRPPGVDGRRDTPGEANGSALHGGDIDFSPEGAAD
jgi:hypothetical protein